MSHADSTVRALVVDDSATARALLVALLDADPGITVVGEAANGAEAVARTRSLRPSVVVMDIEMPGLDGFEATKQIMTESPTPIVIVTSAHDPRDVAVSLAATQVGALTVQPKPVGPSSPEYERDAQSLRVLVKALADVKVVRRRSTSRPSEVVVRPRPSGSTRPLHVVGVAASTGGPPALHRFLGALPREFDAPLLVVQHIAKGFVDGLVRWLQAATPLPVRLAAPGDPIVGPGVYVAPDDRHLEAGGDGRVVLTNGPPVNGFRPSASVLFESLARIYGERAAVVVLTGMGADGVEGARALRACGGRVLAQDERTSTVFGMPKAVVSAGLADAVGPVEALAAQLATQDGRQARG